jgi:hypothetical protein
LSVENRINIEPVIDGEFIWNDQNGLLILKPTNGFNENTTYNVTLVNPIFDLEGSMLVRTFSWEFTTLELPRIINYSPEGDFVDTNTDIIVIFDHGMNKTSVQDAFSIEPEINGTFKWINDKKLVFEPNDKLPELTTFEITIDYLAQDLFGNNLQDDFSWSFRTGDFTVPEIISYSPTGENVAVDIQISIVFSEPMNKSRVETSFSISTNIDGVFQWRGNTLVFIPDNNLKYDTKYNITLTSDATDKWGNNLVDDLSWEFTTENRDGNEGQDTSNDIILISGIILIVIILVIVFIFILSRKRKDTSTEDIGEPKDETMEE